MRAARLRRKGKPFPATPRLATPKLRGSGLVRMMLMGMLWRCTSLRWRIVCRQLEITIDELRFTNFFVMDNNTDNNQEKAEHFIALVRERVQSQMAHLHLASLMELLTSMVAHVALRTLKINAGDEVEPELAQMAGAAAYFLSEAGINMKMETGGERHE